MQIRSCHPHPSPSSAYLHSCLDPWHRSSVTPSERQAFFPWPLYLKTVSPVTFLPLLPSFEGFFLCASRHLTILYSFGLFVYRTSTWGPLENFAVLGCVFFKLWLGTRRSGQAEFSGSHSHWLLSIAIVCSSSGTLCSTEAQKANWIWKPWSVGPWAVAHPSQALFMSSSQAPEQQGEGSEAVPCLGPNIRRRGSKLLGAAPHGGGSDIGNQWEEKETPGDRPGDLLLAASL